MSFRHIALFRWQPGTPDEQIDRIATELRAFAATMPGVRSYTAGADLGLADGAFDFAVVADFDDQAAYEAYRDHPQHRHIAEDIVGPARAERAVIQLEI